MIQNVIDLILPLATLVVGAGGSWWLWQAKHSREKAKLASEQYSDVSKLVDNYIRDLAEMSAKVQELHEELTEARRELNELRAKK